MRARLRSVWEGWKRFAFWLGDKQATLIYTVLYYVLVGPIALARQPFSDPLGRRRRGEPTFWAPRAPVPPTLDEARRQ
jgi:hypothetical protein